MDHRFASGSLHLSGHLARAPHDGEGLPGLILCHGYPSGAAGASAVAATYPELADRIAAHVGWEVLTFTFRGCGQSQGDFSLAGWLADVRAAVTRLRAEAPVRGVWLAGFGTGGALCLCAAADEPSVEGVAVMGAPADFDDWANHPRRLYQHAREVGAIRSPSFPASEDRWARELRQIRPVAAARKLAPRPLLVIHGSEDHAVPNFDARVLSDAHGSAELRIIGGAGHALRDDPRAVAVLLGWLDRQKNRAPGLPAAG